MWKGKGYVSSPVTVPIAVNLHEDRKLGQTLTFALPKTSQSHMQPTPSASQETPRFAWRVKELNWELWDDHSGMVSRADAPPYTRSSRPSVSN